MFEKFEIDVDYSKAGLDTVEKKPELSAILINYTNEICYGGKKPAVVICPGGGYDFCSDREAEAVALRYASHGVNAFVLRYSCVKKRFPTALLEVAEAVALVRKNSEEWNIDSDKIFVCGFSAGGHLAASLAVHWNSEEIISALGYKNGEHKPNGAILSYPVITSNPEYTHEGSILNIIGEEKSEEMLEKVSLENYVSEKTPPTFIWHTADDGCVKVENTLFFVSKLSKYGIPFECHIFDKGVHGLALADETTAAYEGHVNAPCSKWFDLALDFMKRL